MWGLSQDFKSLVYCAAMSKIDLLEDMISKYSVLKLTLFG